MVAGSGRFWLTLRLTHCSAAVEVRDRVAGAAAGLAVAAVPAAEVLVDSVVGEISAAAAREEAGECAL